MAAALAQRQSGIRLSAPKPLLLQRKVPAAAAKPPDIITDYVIAGGAKFLNALRLALRYKRPI
jgi:hypothetical protein